MPLGPWIIFCRLVCIHDLHCDIHVPAGAESLETRLAGSLCQLVRFFPGAGDTEHRYRCGIITSSIAVSVEAPNPVATEDCIAQRVFTRVFVRAP